MEPALDIGYSSQGDGGPVYDASECEEIRDGFKVTLENIDGYFHDKDVPDELTVHFRWGALSAFSSEHRPDIDEDGVHWPQEGEMGIGPGMRIGGQFVEEPVWTERWAIRVGDPSPMMYQVIDDEIIIQEERPEFGRSTCREEPYDELEALGESGLLAKLEALDADGELYIEPGERALSVHESPLYDEDPPRFPSSGVFVAYCILPDDGEDECADDGDCGDGYCMAGECVECVDDDGCEPGTVCDGGQCVEEM